MKKRFLQILTGSILSLLLLVGVEGWGADVIPKLYLSAKNTPQGNTGWTFTNATTNNVSTDYWKMINTNSVIISAAMNLNTFTNETCVIKLGTFGTVEAAKQTITVYISTDNGSTWSASIATRTPTSSGSTAMASIDLSSYSGTQVKLKFANLGGDVDQGVRFYEAYISGTAASATAPTVTTLAASGETSSSAVLNGNISATGGADATERGFYYSTTNGFADGTGTKISSTGTFGTGTFSQTPTGLTASNTYYFKSFATNSAGTSYGSQQSFSTTASSLTPPTLTADASSNTVDNNIDITFTDDASWRSAITAVKIGGTALTVTTDYVITAGNIQLKPSGGNTLLRTAGSKTVTVEATGYTTASATQQINVGAAAKLAMKTQPAAPASNGAVLATQPAVYIQDQYGNTTTSTASVTATVGAGTWTIGGTASVNGISGTVTFSGLTATSAASVTGATITFTSTGLTGVTSGTFNIPAPPAPAAPTATAASSISASGFTANWGAVSGATGYRLDVYTGSVSEILNTSFESSTSFPAGWVQNSSYVNNSSADAYGGTYFAGMNAANDYFYTPILSSPQTISFWTKASSATANNTVKVQYSSDGSTWTDLASYNANGSNTGSITDSYSQKTVNANLTGNYYIRWFMSARSGGSAYFDVISITGGTQTYVSGFQDYDAGNVITKAITGLTASTQYFYVVRAYNASGTSVSSNEIDVTTSAGASPTITAPSPITLSGFSTPSGTASASQTFTVGGSNLTANLVVTAPTNYEVRENGTGSFGSSVSFTPASGTVATKTIEVRIAASAGVGSPSGNVVCSSTDATSQNVAVSGTVLNPEPTNHVTGFAATTSSTTHNSITLEWTDASGAQLPDGYLVKASTVGFGSIATPSDGTAEADAALVKNIAHGVQTVEFTGLTSNTTYYFKIWPYTNSGSDIDYKTGSEPQASETTDIQLVAPTATAPSNITKTGFTANWNAVSGATGYEIDVYTVTSGGPASETEAFDGITPNGNLIGSATYLSGWSVSSQSGTRQIYTTVSNFGVSSPSLAFTTTGDYIETATYASPITELSFWAKQQSGATSSTLIQGYNGSNWSTIATLSNADVATAGTQTYDLVTLGKTDIVKIKMTYTKVDGNLAIDDVKVTYGASSSLSISGSPFTVNGSTNKIVTGLDSAETYYYVVRAVNSTQTTVNSNEIALSTKPGAVTNIDIEAGTNSATITWTRGNGDGVLVKVSNAPFTVSSQPTDGTDYTSSINTTYGGTGEQWVYDDAGTSVVVTLPSSGFDINKLNVAIFEYSTYDDGSKAVNKIYNQGKVLDYDGEEGFLPVNLLSFSAEKQENRNLILWATASEINNNYFTIERSLDAISFEEIGTVNGAGTSNSNRYYQFIDASDINSTVYYRLKQTDYDGQFSFSQTIALENSQLKQNLNSAVLQEASLDLIVTSSTNSPAFVKIYSADGRLLVETQLLLNNGKQSYQIDIPSLPSGLYFINLVSDQGVNSLKVLNP
jgi:hypothetical protein